MNLIRIIKLLWRNILLLIAVPVILALLVRYLTKDEVLKYESETTLFTGLASGQSLDQSQKSFSIFAANNAFDNLLNLIKSREVAAETGIRLIVQHLTLEKEDHTIISSYNYKWVRDFMPAHIKSMIVNNEVPKDDHKKIETPDTEAQNDTVFLKNGDIVFKNRLYHFVKSDEDIQSIAKSYNVSVGALIDVNSLTSSGLAVGFPLIIRDDSADGEALEGDLYDPAQVVASPITEKLSNYEKNVQRLLKYANQNDTNYLFKLLNSRNPYYSISSISSVTARRVQSSDMVMIKYSSFDPGICQNTLIFMTEVVIRRFRSIKANESDAVVRYFLNEVNNTAKRLQNAEDRLLKFNEQNSIINYYEQSKAVAIQKEQLDVAYQDEQVKFASASAVLKRLEEKMDMQQSIQLKTSTILSLRNKLSEVTTQITMTESFKDPDPKNRAKLLQLKQESEKLKSDLHQRVAELYNSNTTIEGLPLDNLLTSWLTNVIEFEQSRASMKILANRIHEFYEYYKTFAPLGATQKRLEREINVAEQEYLSLLHSLNLSKLAQQNVELASDIKAVDPPYLPLSPLPGKAKLLVVAAAVAGFFFVAFLIIVLEFIDSTIRTPEQLEELSRLKVIAAFPRIIPRYSPYNLKYITKRLIEQVVHEVKLEIAKKTESTSGPKLILVLSTMKSEGKSFISNHIARSFFDYDEEVCLIVPSTSDHAATFSDNTPGNSLLQKLLRYLPFSNGYQPDPEQQSNERINRNTYIYTIDNKYFESSSIRDLNYEESPPSFYNYKYIVLEIPSVISYPYPNELVKSGDVSLWITRSTRSWKKADTYAINAFVRSSESKPLAILNGVEIDVIEDFLGDLPKRRTKIRRTLKRIISMQFHERYGFDK